MVPEKPVVLVHASGLDHSDWHQPNLQGTLLVLAASKLYLENKISRIVFVGGQYKTNEKEMGVVMSNYLNTLLPDIPHEDIIVIPKAVTTRAEIKIFKDLVKKMGWDNLADISSEDHIPRITKIINREFDKNHVDIMSLEEVLTSGQNEDKFQEAIPKLRDSNKRKGQKIIESMLTTVESSPILGSIVDWVAHKIPSKCYLETRISMWLGERFS